MSRLLPSISDRNEFDQVRANGPAFWLPAIRALASRHGHSCGELTRFSDGEYLVFASGDAWVLKLVPPFAAGVLTREITMLRSLPGSYEIPVPTMLGHGELDGWHYLFSTRIPGMALHRVWPTLARAQQESLAEGLGRMLRQLHEAPLEDARSMGFSDWNDLVRESTARWPTRWGIERVRPPLREDGPRFLAAAGLREFNLGSRAWRRLHGDLAPENALADHTAGAWRLTGMIDFGNAMVGDPLFDFTAPTVLLQPGDATIVRGFLTGAGVPPTKPLAELRSLLMAYTLIHPMADLRDCLDLLPGGSESATWDEVAARFWPDES